MKTLSTTRSVTSVRRIQDPNGNSLFQTIGSAIRVKKHASEIGGRTFPPIFPRLDFQRDLHRCLANAMSETS